MKYSLSKYIATISIPASLSSVLGMNVISIGGQGSYTESITVELNNDMWSVEGDFTGSYVMNRNDDSTGVVTFSLKQLTDSVRQLLNLCNVYKASKQLDEGVTIEVRSTDGTMVATCLDCMPRRIPAQVIGNTATNQSWQFVSGNITFH